MKEIIIQLVTATLATLGFSVIFYVHPRRLPLAMLGGFVSCGVYLLAGYFMEGELLPNFLAAAAGAVYSEICARVTHVPVPVYILPAVIPLAPGSGLYNTMFHLVTGEYLAAGAAGWVTLQVAFGIAGGIVVASVLGFILRPRKHKYPKA